MQPLRLSVRKIVETVLRRGDIDSRYSDSSSMLDGAKAHRKIQKSMGKDYKREVSLKLETEINGISAVIFGRADGIISLPDGGIVIDEIKTTALPIEKLYEHIDMHLGQAKCYARMLLDELDNPPDEISVQLTCYQLETGELKRHIYPFTSEEIYKFFDLLIFEYAVWLAFERDWRETRDKSIKLTGFPFESYRKGQRELAVAVYRAVEKRKKLYIQAPTGIGKTLSTLFPSVKSMAEGFAEKIFYLTAKTVTRAAAEDAVRLMAAKGLKLKSITLRAKDKICFQAETICTPDFCPNAKGHYDRINEALLDILGQENLITPAIIEEYARKHRVCPYEFSLDVALWTDLVICDYNHVFDPVVYLRRFFGDGGGEYVFLIDETHNLLERVRDIYSASLSKATFLSLKKDLKDKNPVASRLRGAINGVNSHFLAVRKDIAEKDAIVGEELDTELVKYVGKFVLAAEEWLAMEKNKAHPLQNDVLNLFFDATFFVGIAEGFGENYANIAETNGSNVSCTLFCLNPSDIIAQKLSLARSSVLFSATLTPLQYYMETLGGGDEGVSLSLPSPFERKNLLLTAHVGISTKYADRESSISPIADAINAAISKKRGNYIVYFPSYEYMRKVFATFCERYPENVAVMQESAMDEDERERFLQSFSAENTDGLTGFCVLGGIFSEGIDLKGDRLIGSIVVGVGLPGLSLRQDLIRDYFQRKNGAGYDFAYVFPGMNKVLQAAGRVIRTESDCGLVLLIDSRFGTAKYRALFPPHWSYIKYVKALPELENLLDNFEPFNQRDTDAGLARSPQGQ